MKKHIHLLLGAISLSLIGCQHESHAPEIVSQRYIHKYGYDVAPSEWETQEYPGQVLTTTRDGVSIVESYEEGNLHGPRTESFPHSNTHRLLEDYEHGCLVKRITYNLRGSPEKETIFLSPKHTKTTCWYPAGTPKSKEEYQDSQLISAEYFNLANETDSRIEKGTGERTLRNNYGDLLSKEVYQAYALTYVESYYPNNSPHMVTSYDDEGQFHGEKLIFAMTGEPLVVENYLHGKKHGLCTYFQNGLKYLEIPYNRGLKEGAERRFVDGEITVEETQWRGNGKHGPSVLYSDGIARTTWYYQNEKVSKSKFEELRNRDEVITAMGHQTSTIY